MRVGAILWALALCASCGRIGFDDGTSGGGGGGGPDAGDPFAGLPVLPSVATVEVGAQVQRLLVSGNIIYAATTRATNPLVVFDISNPTSPVEIGSIATAGTPNDFAVVGNLLYVVTDTGGDDLEVFDVSAPATPVKLGGIAAADSALRVAVQNDRAYVTSAAAGDDLEIFDVTSPGSITKLGGVDLVSGYYARGVAIAYPYVYAASSKVNIFDVSVPSTPVPVSEMRFYWYSWDMTLAGNRVIGLDSNNGNEPQLRVWDVSNPAAPSVVGMADIWDSYGRDVEVVGDRAYTVCAPGGYSWGAELEVWDIAGAPRRVAHAHLASDGWAVTTAGNYAYVGRMENGNQPELEVFDLR